MGKKRIDAETQPILWAGMHQLESVLKALNMSLNGNVFPAEFQGNPQNWLKEQGCENLMQSSPVWSAIFDGFAARFGMSIEQRVSSYFAPGPGMANFGEERSGAGWRDPANFLITSAFIRVLAAWEQFEMDALKALFYYRAGGVLGPDCERIEEVVDYRLIDSVPNDDAMCTSFSYEPPIWAYIEKEAQNIGRRREIFRKVFKIETSPDGDTESARAKREAMYVQRAKIVHGRDGVSMSLSEFLDAAAFVAKSMDLVAEQCKTIMKVSL